MVSPATSPVQLSGFPRSDGRKGIRNVLVVVYLVECAHHVAREIVCPFRERGVHLIGFPGCYPNAYAHRDAGAAVHASRTSAGAARLARLRRLQPRRPAQRRSAHRAARPTSLGIQETGGTRKTIAAGRAWVEATLAAARSSAARADGRRRTHRRHDLRRIGCHQRHHRQSRDGRAFDLLVEHGAAAIFEETGELIGCEHIMAARAATPDARRRN